MDTNAKPLSVGLTPVVAVPAVAEPAAAVPPVAVSVDTGETSDRNPASQQAEDTARYRLIIEEGPTLGTFVYKTLDGATGEVVRQFPREQVLRMAESGDYSAGGLIDTSA